MYLFLDYLPYFINNNQFSGIIQNGNLQMDINSPVRSQALEKNFYHHR